MENQLVTILYALVFLGAEIVWLATIRNRYIILVSCATILVGVQGVSLIAVRDRFMMGPGYLMEYLGKLLIIDVFFLLSLWLLFYTRFDDKAVTVSEPPSGSTLINTFSTIDLILSQVSSTFKAILVLITFGMALISMPFGIMSIFIPLFWPLIIEFPRYLTYSRLYQLLPLNLIHAIGSTGGAALIGWVVYIGLSVSVILTKRSFWTILYLVLVFLLVNNVTGCQRSLDTSW